MQAMTFDEITRAVGEVATRRSVLRLLGGAVLSAGLVLGAGGESLARGRNETNARGGSRAQAQRQTR